ncbi:FtsK/SpoIIIE family DNA translocase [Paenibacillus sp. 1001270B_150601_E10]|uniref:FtsK/SpoIIIE family DNA translocase n=1 Tax=Paenibacillus sp. 1001270B_150601_E10 TaxID=2787079 RepID=UPI001E2840CA|nr:DNA translocase FtsK [Paenibacillus sp. 1001270B_150601_E10]
MARRKKKKQSFSKSLKYEMYGILLITSAVIALSGGATFGRALSKLFGLMLGKFYFVIPLLFIYIGLAVMIKRSWPKGWSSRNSGLACIVLSLTMMSTLNAVELRLLPVAEDISAGQIFHAIHNTLQTDLLQAKETGSATDMWNKNISGGYIGAAAYCLLYGLFGALGTKLLTIVLLIIGFMLAAQLSYVELVRLIRKQVGKFVKLLKKKHKARLNERKLEQKQLASSKRTRAEAVPDFSEDEEENGPERRTSKTPVFFQLFGLRRTVEEEEHEEDELDEWAEPAPKRSGKSSRARGVVLDQDPWDQDQTDSSEGRADSRFEDHAHEGPVFHDFNHEKAWSQEAEESWSADDTDEDWQVQAPQDPLTPALPAADPDHASQGALNGLHDEQAIDDNPSEDDSPIVQAPPKPVKPYKLPGFHLLSRPQGSGKGGDQADFMQMARKLEATLESFGVRAKVLQVVRGPAVTRFEIQPDIGVKVSRIVNLSDDIALALAAKDIRMEAPIPGKSAIGIEVPNNEVSVVTLREVMETPTFMDAPSKMTVALGRDISGTPIIGNLARMPHLLVAGATGSGKSVCINGIIASILYKAKPDEVKFLMVDPKMVELNIYNGIPHLLAPVVTDPRRASLALKKIVVEMEKRYELFSKSGTRNIEGYNKLVEDNKELVLPYIVVIVDELADLMMVAAHDVEDAICRLAQMARAAGIHLIIATQRPSVDVITGVIKANIPSRIAFGVSSQVDSRTILDMAGAEKLLGRGDMLYLPMGSSKPVRVQGAFLSDQEVEAVVTYCQEQETAQYNEELVPELDENGMEQDEPMDELYDQAVQIVLEGQQASASLLQRRLRVGYNRASRLIESMQTQGIVGPPDGSRPREVLLTLEQYQQMKMSS